MRHHHAAVVLATLAVALWVPRALGAQRGARAEKPTGAEIAMKARAARLDRANVGQGQFQGKQITFTPAVLPPRSDLGSGQVIGVLENAVDGDETGLPAGKYNVFAARLADGWHVYAESGGQIVKEALNVQVARRAGQPAEKRPRIRAKGWGVDVDYSRDIVEPPAPVASVKIVASSTSVLMGESKQYAIELRDATGNLLSGRSITWASGATTIATAPALAAVKGVTAGSATFTATSEGKTASVTVQVPAPVYSLYFPSALQATVGSAYYPVTQVLASGCYVCGATNTSEIVMANSAPNVVSVMRSSGGGNTTTGSAYVNWRIQALAPGTATLTTSFRGLTKSMVVTVSSAPAASLTITPSPLAVVVGQAQQLTATLRDANGNPVSAPITWSSDAFAIADVTSTGRVAGVSLGNALVTASGAGISAVVAVKVSPPPVGSVTVAPAPSTVEQNQFTALTATVRDQAGNALADRSVVWTSSNLAVAEVTSSGRVIGVAPGVALVTATSEGKSGSSAVTVTSPATASAPTETLSFNW